MSVSTDEVRQMLLRVASRQIEATEQPKDCCDRNFQTSDGWQFTIFDDCGQMDYVSEAIAPDGRKGDFDSWATEDSFNNPLPDEWRHPTPNALASALRWDEGGDYVSYYTASSDNSEPDYK